MNKNPILLVLFLFSLISPKAQEVSFGLNGGVNYNYIGDFYSIGGSISSGTPNEYFPAEQEMGYQVGAFFDIRYNYFFIRPEGSYVSLKNTYNFPTKPAAWEAQQINIGLLFGYNIIGPVSIFAGPTFSFISNMELEGVEDDPGRPFTYKETATYISGGLLFDFGRVGVDFRYLYGLTTVENLPVNIVRGYNGYGVNLGELVEYNPSQFMINVQVNLFTLNGSGGKREKGSKSEWRNHKNL
jgi:hypothetical protein